MPHVSCDAIHEQRRDHHGDGDGNSICGGKMARGPDNSTSLRSVDVRFECAPRTISVGWTPNICAAGAIDRSFHNHLFFFQCLIA